MGRWFDEATEFWALRTAARRAARGGRSSAGTASFLCELETEVLTLQRELRSGSYQPGAFHVFPIREPKPRLISAAPFRDRVVHHALCAALEPTLEAEADPDSYACRRGKGTLAALRRIQAHTRSWPWFGKLDVHHCFETANLDLLRSLLAARFADVPLLAVMDRIFERGADSGGRGLPIGNLTSQHLANLLLGEVDRKARRLQVGGWVRYMDDMFLFGPDRVTVGRWSEEIADFIRVGLLQAEKPAARRLGPVSAGVPALGFRVWPRRVRLDGARRRRLLCRLRGLERARRSDVLTDDEAARRAASVLGWAAHGDTLGLRQSLVSSLSRSNVRE